MTTCRIQSPIFVEVEIPNAAAAASFIQSPQTTATSGRL
jgi:hypothetical protein